MTTWLRIALAAQLAFFALWGARLLTSHRDGTVVWLATEPVDPRDVLSGHYVALRYRIDAPDGAGCRFDDPAHMAPAVWVRLAPTGEPIMTDEGPADVAEAVDCQTERPSAGADDVWILGHPTGERGRRRLLYGIERMYVAEESPLRRTASGSVVAKVAINDAFEPRLLGLVAKREPSAE